MIRKPQSQFIFKHLRNFWKLTTQKSIGFRQHQAGRFGRRLRPNQLSFESMEPRQLLAGTVDAPIEIGDVGFEQHNVTPEGVFQGRLYHDVNHNGRRDGGENWLSNWNVFGDRNGDQIHGPGERRTVTDHQGYFNLFGFDSSTSVTPSIKSSEGSLGNVSPEVLVNTNVVHAQMFSDVAVYDAGSVVVWSSWLGDGSGWGVFGQRFDAASRKVGGEFQVNTETKSLQMKPSVTAFNDGHFFVVWQSLNQDPNPNVRGWGIYGQRFGADGSRLGGEVRLNETTYGHQHEPVIQKLENRNLAVAWQGFGRIRDGQWGFGVIARTFNANLEAMSSEIRISSVNFGNDQQFDLAPLPNGGFAAAFQGSASPDYSGVYVRQLGSRLEMTGPSMWLVNQYRTEARQWQPAIDANSQGKLVVSWTSDTGDRSGKAVFAQVMNPDFTLPFKPTLVAQKWAGTQWRSDVQWVGDENFVVSWQGKGENDSNGVFGRVFDQHGAPLGAELRLSDSSRGLQDYASIDVGNDRLVAAWHGNGTGDHYGVYSRSVELVGTRRANGSISGLVFDDENGNGVQDGQLIRGTDPNVVFVIDVSGSTTDEFAGGSVGDLNSDGESNTILDGQIAGFEALIDELIRQGLGDVANVSVVAFDSDANTILEGVKPNQDTDGNGVSDVKDALRGTVDLNNTNFEDALRLANELLVNMGTSPENGNVIFLSDGVPTAGGAFDDEVVALRRTANNVRAFGVGNNASLADLVLIDPMAINFTTTDELLDVFGGGASTGGSVGSGGAIVSNAEAGRVGALVYLDRNNNGRLDAGEQSTRTATDNPATPENEAGQYVFNDLPAGNYVVRVETAAGERVSAPADTFFAVALAEDAQLAGLNFGVTTVVSA